MRRLCAYLLVGLSVLTGCRKEPVHIDSAIPVNFSSGVDGSETKTTTIVSFPTSSDFGVFGYFQQGTGSSAGSWNGSQAPNFMFNQQVSHNGTAWTYVPIKFWPNSELNTVSFWAYSPYREDLSEFKQSGGVTAYISASTGLPVVGFTADGTQDFMVSDLVTNQSYSNTNSSTDGLVSLLFHHALSKITIKVAKSDTPAVIKVTGVGINDVYSTAVYTRTTEWSWNNFSNKINYTFYAPSLGNEQGLTTVAVALPGVSLLIPQSLGTDSGGVKLHIDYTVGGVSMSGNIILGQNESDCWEPNIQYIYTVTISPEASISFSANIVSWGDPVQWEYHHVD